MTKHPLLWKLNRIYANLPIGLRKEIVSVVNNEPMTWHVVWMEANQGTQMGYDAIEQLKRLGII